MGYRQGARGPRSSGRGRGIPRHEKAKAKKRKNQSSSVYLTEETPAATYKEIVDKTVGSLRNLGKQVFALSPFSDHFDRWLTDIKMVLSEFESSPFINVDDYFTKERSEILSRVERELAERKHTESFVGEAVRQLSESRSLLRQIEEEYVTEKRKFESRKSSKIKRLNDNIDGIKEELDTISRMKTGIFRGFSKKAKAQKEADATRRLNQAESELASAEQSFTHQQKELNGEYEKKKRPIVSQIVEQQKEVDRVEVDGSIESRMVACDRLIDVLTRFLERKGPQSNPQLE